jgi:ubiquinone/menaquinone biosynthesis C-methylase UbiE
MAHETLAQNDRAIEALGVVDGDNVLDIGCGPGRSLSELATRTPKGRVVGSDPSQLMTEIASRRNQALVGKGRVQIVIAGAEALPFADNTFDKALCVHVLYFWSDLRASFREIARVLRPGGKFALLFRSTRDHAAVNAFPAEVYSFRDVADVRDALLAEGFQVAEHGPVDDGDSDGPAPHLLLAARTAR